MFSHVMVGSNDIDRSKKFYDAVFGAMGAKPATVDPKGRLIYTHNGGRFMVSKPIDGPEFELFLKFMREHPNVWSKVSCPERLSVSGPPALDGERNAYAWHKAGCANGGKSIEDPPGIRQGAAGPMYLAYLRDPDGNKLCAFARVQS